MYTPPVGFHFRVEVLGLDTPKSDDMRFVEVGGLSVESGSEEVPEGGENRFVQRYPGRMKYGDLVLKRGLLTASSVWEWARKAIDDLDIEPRDVDVTLLDAEHRPLVTWHVVGAYPVKWALSELNATANAFVVETLTLAYRHFRVDRG
jgi:phage tail-like protein